MTSPETRRPPVLAVTLGDPRGIGPEIVRAALEREQFRGNADFVIVGPGGMTGDLPARTESVGAWPGEDGERTQRRAGELAGRAIHRALEMALAGEVDGLVTAPVAKDALAAAGYPYPGHTEFLRDESGVSQVTMMMTAEETPLGGPLRMGLLTGHLPLREVARRLTPALALERSRIAAGALRRWWGLERPRLAFAGVNPHASEGGLFGDEEARVLEPTAGALASEGEVEVDGIFPADTVFRRCLDGRVDAVLVPYHDVGLAVLKTVSFERGVNVTAGLPFPRTSPDHGTARDIAGTGRADPGSMIEAVRLCLRFCRQLQEAG